MDDSQVAGSCHRGACCSNTIASTTGGGGAREEACARGASQRAKNSVPWGEVGLCVLQKVFGWGLGNLSVNNSYATGLMFVVAYLGPLLSFVIIVALLYQAPAWAFVLLLAQALLSAPYIQQPIFWLCAAAIHASIPEARKRGLRSEADATTRMRFSSIDLARFPHDRDPFPRFV